MISLTYVSRIVSNPDFSGDVVQEISRVSAEKNRSVDITGALISTGDYYVQMLEGREADVNDVFRRISRDPRHTDVTVIDVTKRPRRWFKEWSLAFAGRSHFTSVRLAPLISTQPAASDVQAALKILRAFATGA